MRRRSKLTKFTKADRHAHATSANFPLFYLKCTKNHLTYFKLLFIIVIYFVVVFASLLSLKTHTKKNLYAIVVPIIIRFCFDGKIVENIKTLYLLLTEHFEYLIIATSFIIYFA